MSRSQPTSVRAIVADRYEQLSASHRLLADEMLADPEKIAFGTVESIAKAVEVSNPTVVRFAVALGFPGFTELRDQLRNELSERLRTAVQRVQHRPQGSIIEQVLKVETENLTATLGAIDQTKLNEATGLLADPNRNIWIMPSSQLGGTGSRFADELALCRTGVSLIDGSEFRAATILTAARPGDVLVTLDIQRHEAWLVRAQRRAVAAGAVPVALTDQLPCSLDLSGGVAFTFACQTAGVFDSQLGVGAVAAVLLASVVDRNRTKVAKRLAALEATWTSQNLLSP